MAGQWERQIAGSDGLTSKQHTDRRLLTPWPCPPAIVIKHLFGPKELEVLTARDGNICYFSVIELECFQMWSLKLLTTSGFNVGVREIILP